VNDDRPLSLEDITAWFADGAKPATDWRVGAEHEKFGFYHRDHATIPYAGEDGIQALMQGLTDRFGWRPAEEGGHVIALTRNGASVSLEPGGQFELSGAPLADAHLIRDETANHLEEVRAVGADLGLGFLALGFHPTIRRDQAQIMPKGRYDLMRRYMPLVGNLGLDMMLRTCTVQANLDFGGEADMVAKFRASLALQPIVTALFANSPFTEGRPNGFLSARANVWTDTDPDRTGLLDFVFKPGFNFETYARYALDVPMYFVKRDGRYIDVAGQSFRDFMDGRLPGLPGERPTIKDWEDHTTTLFPEVRLKTFLEMRGADSGPLDMLSALPALWIGLLYDDAALAAALELVSGWSMDDMQKLRADVPRLGLKATIAGRSARDVAVDMVAIAKQGLAARRRACDAANDETGHLEVLEAIADSGITQAERLLEKFHGAWDGNIAAAFTDCAY
jgi:glutamate--cysteine ligase